MPSVATLWTKPGLARPLDRPSLGNPVDMRAWNRALSTPARLWLVGKLETQALYGSQVRVLEQRGGWSRIVAAGQPTPRDRRGYPGWVPTVQLVDRAAHAGPIALVTRPTAWLLSAKRRRTIELSYGTRLRYLGTAKTLVKVATPSGGHARLRRSDVSIYLSVARIPRPSGAAIAASASAFVGVRYLLAGEGTSAFGFDCSGLIHLVYRAHGVVIPVMPTPRPRPARRSPGPACGPVTCSSTAGRTCTDAALYVGDGLMLEAPNSASSVRIVPLRSGDYAGARRYV